MHSTDRPQTVADLTALLREGGYLADRGLSTALFVALSLGRPILLEGEVGVGKTEVAKVLAATSGRRLIRLQCYEGIDTNQALYEWDYARQMLQIRALSEHQLADDAAVDKLFGPKFLLERPLLEAVRVGDGAVLLIDEIDRADDEFEAFLLELLSDFQITIPEIGTIRAETPPLVVLTSNRTRELHDALKRRCLYHWVGYPNPEREVEIVLVRAPGVQETLARKVVAAVNRLRDLDLAKPPGVAETLDWVSTLGLGPDHEVRQPAPAVVDEARPSPVDDVSSGAHAGLFGRCAGRRRSRRRGRSRRRRGPRRGPWRGRPPRARCPSPPRAWRSRRARAVACRIPRATSSCRVVRCAQARWADRSEGETQRRPSRSCTPDSIGASCRSYSPTPSALRPQSSSSSSGTVSHNRSRLGGEWRDRQTRPLDERLAQAGTARGPSDAQA